MELHELSFGKVVILRKDIAEVIINEGVEMDRDMVEQFHDFLLEKLSSPFSLVINKINNYSYSFDAQKSLGALNELNAIAVVVYTRISEATTESVSSFPREIKWNMKMFSNRDEAMTG